MTKQQSEAITKHGLNLLAIFPNATEQDPVKLCKKLHRLEVLAHAGATASCNGTVHHVNGGYVFDFHADENAWEKFSDMILRRVSKALGTINNDVPVFVNGDARGYALKIDSDWLSSQRAAAKHKRGLPIVELHSDMGGYGIIAPEIGKDGR